MHVTVSERRDPVPICLFAGTSTQGSRRVTDPPVLLSTRPHSAVGDSRRGGRRVKRFASLDPSHGWSCRPVLKLDVGVTDGRTGVSVGVEEQVRGHRDRDTPGCEGFPSTQSRQTPAVPLRRRCQGVGEGVGAPRHKYLRVGPAEKEVLQEASEEGLGRESRRTGTRPDNHRE